MRPIVAVFLMVSALSSSLHGQDRKNPEYLQEYPGFPLQKNEKKCQNDSLHKRFSDIPGSFLREHPEAFGFDNRNEFPGASRYYAKSRFPALAYEKSFIMVPDTANEYYLIIKDPVHDKMIK